MFRVRSLLPALLVACASTQAVASDLVISVQTEKGQPIGDAVVTVEPSQARPRPARFAQPLRVAQHNLQFEPFVLVVPTGADVAFPNLDNTRHQVFSFSPSKTFELKLYSREERRSVHFDKPGVITLNCNIHDPMVAFIKVTDAPFAAKTDGSGRVALHDLPAGPAIVRVWRPYLKAPGNEVRLDLVLPAEGSVERTVKGDVRTPPMRMSGY